MAEEISDAERQFAAKVAGDAMLMGWDRAIEKWAQESGLSQAEVKLTLNRAEEYNDKADPSGRIHELEDWKRQKSSTPSKLVAKGPGKTGPGNDRYYTPAEAPPKKP